MAYLTILSSCLPGAVVAQGLRPLEGPGEARTLVDLEEELGNDDDDCNSTQPGTPAAVCLSFGTWGRPPPATDDPDHPGFRKLTNRKPRPPKHPLTQVSLNLMWQRVKTFCLVTGPGRPLRDKVCNKDGFLRQGWRDKVHRIVIIYECIHVYV